MDSPSALDLPSTAFNLRGSLSGLPPNARKAGVVPLAGYFQRRLGFRPGLLLIQAEA